MKSNLQVKDDHYDKASYDSLERFISYYHQVDAVRRLGVTSVLEIGVGNKLVSSYLSARGLEVKTADFDARVNPDIIADVLSLPLPDNSFQSILACQVLEHIPFSDFPLALAELKRVAEKFVIISLPRRCSYFEMAIKFPLIRRLFKRNFFDFALEIPLNFPGFSESGQHYWEIDRSQYSLSKVRQILLDNFVIVREFTPVLNRYHRFFVLKKPGHSDLP